MTMHCRADDTVWRGAWAVACHTDLDMVATTVARVADSLRAEAAICRHHAVSLEWPR